MTLRTLNACAVTALVIGTGAPARADADADAAPGARAVAEADVIRLVREADPGVARARAAETLADAGLLSAPYPNPELGWGREHLPGPGESEDTFALRVPIALSGARAAERSLARAEGATSRAETHRTRARRTLGALQLFYAALALEQRAHVLGVAVERLEGAAHVLARRHEEGTVSGYDRTRLDLELELARSEQREVHARAETVRARLAARLGLDGTPLSLRGSLLPGEAAGGTEAPASRRLDEQALAHARVATEEADSAWVPALQLEAGLKLANADDTEIGYVAGVSFELPLSDTGEALEARAAATARVARAHLAEEARGRAVLATAALRTQTEMQRELRVLDGATAKLVDGLVRAAESGYREGQRPLVELLDAHQAATRVSLRRIELLHAARRGDLELRAARGELER